MSKPNTPSGPERSVDEIAKKYAGQNSDGPGYAGYNERYYAFKAGFLAASVKGKEEDSVEIIKGLKDIINYFGRHDKTTEEHRMYAVAQKILKTFEHTTG